MGRPGDREHHFTLVLTGITRLSREAEDALFEAGCDDATLCVRFGRVYATFSRSASTRTAAIVSAVRDIRKAKIGADVLRVDTCDLVTQAEIAHRIGKSRQLVNQYILAKRGPGGFPPPSYVGDESPVWNWCEAARWLRQNDFIKEEMFQDAETDAVINTVLDSIHRKKSDPKLLEKIRKAIA